MRTAIEQLLARAPRINPDKPERYWYPLSVASYGVDEILNALDSLVSFRTTMWAKTARFEEQFARYAGSREAVMVNSGSSADLLVSFALVDRRSGPLTPGDEVLVPAVTWPTQIWSLMMAGLSVRFVDVDPKTLNVDLVDLERKIGPRTRGIAIVHLMGNPVDMDRVMALAQQRGLVVIEDCCEALGARWGGRHVGTFGLASAFSFFFAHHITTMEGGMALTDDLELSDRLRLLRAHGWARNTKYTPDASVDGVDSRYVFWNWGFNLRPTEIQAAFGLEQMLRLDGFLEARRTAAERIRRQIRTDALRLMHVPEKGDCSWFALPIVVAPEAPFGRSDLTVHLEKHGVETRPIVAGNLARQPACDVFPELREVDLPGADVVHEHGFYVGLHPDGDLAKVDRLCEVIDDFLRDHT